MLHDARSPFSVVACSGCTFKAKDCAETYAWIIPDLVSSANGKLNRKGVKRATGVDSCSDLRPTSIMRWVTLVGKNHWVSSPQSRFSQFLLFIVTSNAFAREPLLKLPVAICTGIGMVVWVSWTGPFAYNARNKMLGFIKKYADPTVKSDFELKQIHHSNHQRSPIAIGLLKKGKYANGQRLTQLIQAVASQEDPQNLDTHSYDWRYYSVWATNPAFCLYIHIIRVYYYMIICGDPIRIKKYADVLLLQIYTVDREGGANIATEPWAVQ